MSSITDVFSRLVGGTSNEKQIKRLKPLVAVVNEYAATYEQLSDDELKAKTHEFKYRLNTGATLDDLLPEAYAAVKETCRRLLGKSWLVRGQEITWNMVPYDVQILGGIVLHEGKIAEMATGEGKTLVATMPLYLNALSGKGAHLVTVNDYLAQRDCEWMGKIYEFLGLSTAALHGEMTPEERREAYYADITYGTNNEFGFDYLRDNMASDVWNVAQRKLNFAIVDEVDSVLIDESRTPLIISGSVGAPRNIYYELKPIVANLYRRQMELVAELLRQGKELLETDQEAAGMALLRVLRGDPKNSALLELLTSEFWVKKLIEGIQGQYEINKEIHIVDAELYYTIDEKSHVVDITEKGRIFLSGGRDQDIVRKIGLLDALDEQLGKLAEQKNPQRFFSADPLNGLCDGITLAGQVALAGAARPLEEPLAAAAERLAARIAALSEAVTEIAQQQKIDKAAAWRQLYSWSKKADRLATGLTDKGMAQLTRAEEDPLLLELAQTYGRLLALLEPGEGEERLEIERRREFAAQLFELDKNSNAPVALRPEGRIALLALHLEGDPQGAPFIARMDQLLRGGDPLDARHQEYFEFNDKGGVPRHVAEKGRIALLGGNPDLYILPDRTLVEERDRHIQELLDRTLNQNTFDYTERVRAVEAMEHDLEQLHALNGPEHRFLVPGDEEPPRFHFTEAGAAFLADFAGQTLAVVAQFDRDLRGAKHPAGTIFAADERGGYTGLAEAERDHLLGAPWEAVRTRIAAWRAGQNPGMPGQPLALRVSLDAFLAESFPGSDGTAATSLSRRFEEVERLDRTLQMVFSWYGRTDLSDNERLRHLRRTFEIDPLVIHARPLQELQLNGLSENGMRLLPGSADARSQASARLLQLAGDRDLEPQNLFELDDEGVPQRLKKAARPMLLDNLPFFSFAEELAKFREEVLFLAAKKVNSQQEYESLLAKEKAHLRGKQILLDDREMAELIFKAHAPNETLTAEEIEGWCRLQFERKPRRLLDEQRDALWKDYTGIEERVQNISQLLRAYTLYQRDVDYVVKTLDDADLRGRIAGRKGAKAVMIVDQFTGRLMPGRRYSDGLHEALEAKEGVEVQAESQTLATITIQNFFRLYDKLAGMTGTAETESQEFFSTYKLEVVVIPTNRPVIRDDNNDVIFRTRREKYSAIVDEAIAMHEAGRSVLVGTISVEVSQLLSDMLTQRGVPIANWLKKGDVSQELESGRFHTVLNAKFHRQEAEIVAKAGLPGSITIATNMAGRGTDIKLHSEVAHRGGLHIIGSEKHEARRIDRQLRGRSGRQGDPGSSRFYLSLEDDLMRLFGSDRITTMMSRLGPMEEGERIEHPLITRSIERAQKKVEERNFEIRKHLLDYDNVLNDQRKIIYKRRQNLLGFAGAEDFVESKAKLYFNEEVDRGEWNLHGLIETLQDFFRTDTPFDAEDLDRLKQEEIKETLREWVAEQIAEDQLQRQLQIRHRLMGYAPFGRTLEELVRLKIRLHNGGSRDLSRWNMAGIGYELERIFGTAPEWLAAGSAGTDAAAFENRVIAWAADLYSSRLQAGRAGLDQALFAGLAIEEMVKAALHGLMSLHLNEGVPQINWTVEEFLRDLEHLFEERPQLGVNELRTIQRPRIAAMIEKWALEHLGRIETEVLRHRIIGYFSTGFFVDVLVFYALAEMGDAQARELNPQQQKFLAAQFGSEVLAAGPQENAGELARNLRRSAHVACNERLAAAREGYLQAMLTQASMDEYLTAAILAMIKAIAAGAGSAEQRQRQFSVRIEFILQQRPPKSLPDSRDEAVVAFYAEEIVAWALKWYATFADRQERLHQENLSSEIVRDSVLMMIDDTVYAMISSVLGEEDLLDDAAVRRLESECRLVFRQAPRLADESAEGHDPKAVMAQVSRWARAIYQKRIAELGSERATRYERYFVLEKIDENWRQHLNATDELREGIGLRGYGQKDPLLEYKREAFDLFIKMNERVNRDVTSQLFKFFDVGGEIEERQIRRAEPKNYSATHSQVETFKQAAAAPPQQQGGGAGAAPVQAPVKAAQVVKAAHVGRNDPCPCGSGKKYKNCCGRN
ncbi:MAG TPA: SEC-C metal-binding domain-containing protein [bacterium]|nr:SEC-C metal-binding domain-containing protein [bacterium]